MLRFSCLTPQARQDYLVRIVTVAGYVERYRVTHGKSAGPLIGSGASGHIVCDGRAFDDPGALVAHLNEHYLAPLDALDEDLIGPDFAFPLHPPRSSDRRWIDHWTREANKESYWESCDDPGAALSRDNFAYSRVTSSAALITLIADTDASTGTALYTDGDRICFVCCNGKRDLWCLFYEHYVISEFPARRQAARPGMAYPNALFETLRDLDMDMADHWLEGARLAAPPGDVAA